MNKNIAVIAAHPDDEVLGCGATMAKHVLQGDKVNVLILAEGATSRGRQRDRITHASALHELAVAAQKSREILGISSIVLHDFPDNNMDSVSRLEIIKVIEEFIAKHAAEIVYTHHCGDLNIDHQIVSESVVTACRPLPSSKVERIMFFEVPSSTEWQLPSDKMAFHPNWFVNVADTLALKLKALDAYKTEMRDWPHARSIKAVSHLAYWRGAAVGVEAAEAFMLGRYVQDEKNLR